MKDSGTKKGLEITDQRIIEKISALKIKRQERAANQDSDDPAGMEGTNRRPIFWVGINLDLEEFVT